MGTNARGSLRRAPLGNSYGIAPGLCRSTGTLLPGTGTNVRGSLRKAPLGNPYGIAPGLCRSTGTLYRFIINIGTMRNTWPVHACAHKRNDGGAVPLLGSSTSGVMRVVAVAVLSRPVASHL